MTNIQRLIRTAVLAALICAATLMIQLPLGSGGYANLGDGVLLASACLLGPGPAAAAAGIGSALADVLSGYVVYAPGSLLIKGGMGWMAAMLCAGRAGRGRLALAFAAAEGLMIAGYFVYDALIMGYGMGALASAAGNLAQGAVGAAAALLLHPVLKKIK